MDDNNGLCEAETFENLLQLIACIVATTRLDSIQCNDQGPARAEAKLQKKTKKRKEKMLFHFVTKKWFKNFYLCVPFRHSFNNNQFSPSTTPRIICVRGAFFPLWRPECWNYHHHRCHHHCTQIRKLFTPLAHCCRVHGGDSNDYDGWRADGRAGGRGWSFSQEAGRVIKL